MFPVLFLSVVTCNDNLLQLVNIANAVIYETFNKQKIMMVPGNKQETKAKSGQYDKKTIERRRQRDRND